MHIGRLLGGVVLFLAAAAIPAAAIPAAAAQTAPDPPVVLVGASGLRWDDLDPLITPEFWRLAEDGSIGALSVRAVDSSTCPADGWLTVGAGRRATRAGSGPGSACRPIQAPRADASGSAATVPGWPEIVAANAEEPFDAVPGALGETLTSADSCLTAVGPGAALAAANRAGRVTSYFPTIGTLPPDGLDRCVVTIVDLGTVDQRPTGALPRKAQVRALDRRLAELTKRMPAGSMLIAAGLADSTAAPHLHVAAIDGEESWLTSNSTRRQGIVQLTDLPPTLVDLAGRPQPVGFVGSPWRAGDRRSVPAYQAIQQLADFDTAAQVVRDLVAPFFAALVAAQLALYVYAAAALRKEWGGPARRRRVLAATRRTAIVFASVPVATFLANALPWWRAQRPTAMLCAAVALWTAVIAGTALLARRQLLGPVGVVAGITAGVLAVDVMTGSRLQLTSLMGYSPLVAGRFYGFGNVAFALFATGMLLAAAAAAHALRDRGRAVAVTAALGVLAVAVDGWPTWGSDFGGVLALVPGFAVLIFGLAGIRVTPARFVAILASGIAIVSAVAVVDWLRPAGDRSHLGRFVQQVLDGQAWTVIERKLTANLDILTSNVLTVLVPFAVLFLAFVLMRPVEWSAAALELAYRAAPTLRLGLIATLVTMTVGFAVNDSGIAIPAVSLTVAIPLTLAASVAALLQAERPEQPGAPPAPERHPRTAGPDAAAPASPSR